MSDALISRLANDFKQRNPEYTHGSATKKSLMGRDEENSGFVIFASRPKRTDASISVDTAPKEPPKLKTSNELPVRREEDIPRETVFGKKPSATAADFVVKRLETGPISFVSQKPVGSFSMFKQVGPIFASKGELFKSNGVSWMSSESIWRESEPFKAPGKPGAASVPSSPQVSPRSAKSASAASAKSTPLVSATSAPATGKAAAPVTAHLSTIVSGDGSETKSASGSTATPISKPFSVSISGSTVAATTISKPFAVSPIAIPSATTKPVVAEAKKDDGKKKEIASSAGNPSLVMKKGDASVALTEDLDAELAELEIPDVGETPIHEEEIKVKHNERYTGLRVQPDTDIYGVNFAPNIKDEQIASDIQFLIDLSKNEKAMKVGAFSSDKRHIYFIDDGKDDNARRKIAEEHFGVKKGNRSESGFTQQFSKDKRGNSISYYDRSVGSDSFTKHMVSKRSLDIVANKRTLNAFIMEACTRAGRDPTKITARLKL